MEMKLKSYFIRIIENSREQKQKKPIIQSSAVNATVPLAVSDLFNCEAEKIFLIKCILIQQKMVNDRLVLYLTLRKDKRKNIQTITCKQYAGLPFVKILTEV